MMNVPIEIVELTSASGVLTKRISLDADGRLVSDGSACVMGKGSAKRVLLPSVAAFAAMIANLTSSQAIALGALHPDLADEVTVTTDRKLKEMNGSAPRDLIARTAGHIGYLPKQPAMLLLDYDTKGMPDAVAKRMKDLGGFWSAVVAVAPDLEQAARVDRPSTSSGIVRNDTGAAVKGSDGVHVFVSVQDGADIERFLRTLHNRCWLHGLGWMMVGAAGQLLERSIVDRMVYAGERLVFEGAPILEKPLEQDAGLRAPKATSGVAVNTFSACTAITVVEESKLADLKAAERNRLGSDVAQARTAFVKAQAARLLARFGGDAMQAERSARQMCGGILHSGVELAFDADDLTGATVADVLADPDRFVDATLADPLEGIAYGQCKAKIMRRPDGSMFVNSFAHGHTVYDLKHDDAAVEAAMRAAPPANASDVLVRMAVLADLTPDAEQRLKDLASSLSGVKARPLGAKLKQARAEHDQQRANADRDRERATRERRDARVLLPAPSPNGERLPVMRSLEEVLCASQADVPPLRDMEGHPVEIRERPPSEMHTLVASGSNGAETASSRLPPPALPLLTRHDKYSLAHQIEQHIEFTTEGGDAPPRSVALPPVFVDHYMSYRDSCLPRVSAIVTAPLVMPDGTMLAPDGLDRERKLVFRIAPEMRAVLPKPHDPAPTNQQVAAALNFLANEWLCDVATDFAGKCVLIALALTIIERVLLPERPSFFVTAGKRGGGKTTTLSMVILAVTGKKPAAAAWSNSEEERRKALMAYLAAGLSAMVFDNIPLGSTISCPTIEKILTSESYSDRILGITSIATVPSYTIVTMTGNNIAPKGDLASRSLECRIDVDQADPENRPFRHSDPMAWTLDHRGEILDALYTVLLGNPQLKASRPPRTRFKRWWHLVGSAIEHAAVCLETANWEALSDDDKDALDERQRDMTEAERNAPPVNFVKMFAEMEDADADGGDWVEMLELLYERFTANSFSGTFQAADVAGFINSPANDEAVDAGRLRAFFEAGGRRGSGEVSSMVVGRRLGVLVDAPVRVGDRTMKLTKVKTNTLAARRTTNFKVQVL